MPEKIRSIVSGTNQVEKARQEAICQLREQAGQLLVLYGSRRPNLLFYVGLVGLPIYATMAPFLWVKDSVNPIDRITRRVLRRHTKDGSLVTVSSSCGNVREAFNIKIAHDVGELWLRKEGGFTGKLSPDEPEYHQNWFLRPARSYRNASLEELQAHIPLLESLGRSLEVERMLPK